MKPHHLVLSTVSRESLFLDVERRRAALRTLARVVGPRLWLFGVADDHLHAIVQDDRPTQLGGRLALALRALPGAPAFQPSWAEPVDGRAHLRRLLPYILRQSEHHGLGPTATWEGSCFPDLVGARRLDGFNPTAWREGLPREDVAIVWQAAGMDRPGGSIAGQPLAAIVAACTRAMAVPPDLQGKTDEIVRTRRAAAALAREGGFPADAIANAVRCTASTVRRGGADEGDVRAARRALAIEIAWTRGRQVTG